MSVVQKIARNTGIIIAGNVAFRLISLLITIYLARYLGTTEFGKYSFVFAYLTFFTVLADLGLRHILIREMSRNRSLSPKLMGNVYIMSILLAIFSTILSIIVITLMQYPHDITMYIYIAAFTILFTSLSELYSTIFQVDFKMKYNMFAKIASKIIAAILILWVIFSEGTLTSIIVILVFSEIIKMLLNYILSKKLIRLVVKIDFELCKHLLKESLPLAFSSIIWIIYFRIDIVMLSIMVGDTPVGLYSAAYTLIEPFSLIPYALTVSLFPVMSALFKTSSERLVRSYRLGIKYLLIIMIPVAIGTILLSGKIIFLIYGSEFSDSVIALQILMCSLAVISINSVSLNLLVSMDRQKLNMLIIGLCAVGNIILNLILIPILSYNGAAIATVVSDIAVLLLCFYFVSKHLQVPPVHKISVKPLISGLIMGIFIYYFLNVNIFLLVPLAGIVYAVALLVLKTFSDEDRSILKKILHSN